MNYPQQNKIPEDLIRKKIEEFLTEDAPQGDVTTSGILDTPQIVTARIEAQEPLVFAGQQLIECFFGTGFDVDMLCVDGQMLQTGEVIAVIKGAADEILLRERVLLNLMQRLCGIATETRKYVDIAQPYQVKILDTRKTTPGLRIFEKYAVAVAGGFNHRLNLSNGILIKDNHIKAAGSITNAVSKIRGKTAGLPIEVEVENLSEIKEALACRVAALLLDNLSPADTRAAVEYVRRQPGGSDIFLEASGGIDLTTIADYVKTGIDAVSVGSLTHSVRSSNIHMEFYDV